MIRQSITDQPLRPSRRGFLAGLASALGVAAAGSPARAQKKDSPAKSGPVLFRRNAETERYYKTVQR